MVGRGARRRGATRTGVRRARRRISAHARGRGRFREGVHRLCCVDRGRSFVNHAGPDQHLELGRGKYTLGDMKALDTTIYTASGARRCCCCHTVNCCFGFPVGYSPSVSKIHQGCLELPSELWHSAMRAVDEGQHQGTGALHMLHIQMLPYEFRNRSRAAAPGRTGATWIPRAAGLPASSALAAASGRRRAKHRRRGSGGAPSCTQDLGGPAAAPSSCGCGGAVARATAVQDGVAAACRGSSGCFLRGVWRPVMVLYSVAAGVAAWGGWMEVEVLHVVAEAGVRLRAAAGGGRHQGRLGELDLFLDGPRQGWRVASRLRGAMLRRGGPLWAGVQGCGAAGSGSSSSFGR